MTEQSNLVAVQSKEGYVFNVRDVFVRLLSYLFRYKLLLFVSLIFLMATGAIEASFIAFIEKILKNGFLAGDEWFVRWSGLLLMLVLTIRAVTGYIGNYTMAKVGRLVIFELRRDTFKNLIALPTRYFDKNSSARNVSKLIFDVETTAVAITDTLSIMFRESVKAAGLIVYLFVAEWRLTLIFMLVVPLLVAVVHYTNKRFRKTSKDIQDSVGGIGDTVKEASIGHKVIKVYNGREQEFENFESANQFNLTQNLKRAKVSSAIVPLTMLLVGPAIALILFIFLQYLRAGPESAVEFSAYIMACMALMSPLKRLAKVNEKIQIGATAAHSVFNVIDEPPEEDSGAQRIERTKGHIVFDNVTFQYRDEDIPVLDDVSFEIKPGERVALVGPSGSGKSTIASLMLRFYAPQKGQVYLDSYDVKDVALADLRNQFAGYYFV